jgi:DNA repair protein RadC
MTKPPKLNDLRSLSNAELLSTVLARSPNSQQKAQDLLEKFGLQGIARLPPGTIAQSSSLTKFEAMRIAAAFELGARNATPLARTRICCSKDLFHAISPIIARLRHEEIWALSLDGCSNLIARICVGRGGTHGCAVFARDVLREVLISGASSFALVHNHPSGDPTPSEEDLHLTQSIQIAGNFLGLPLVDHVIVGYLSYTSMHDLGLISEIPSPQRINENRQPSS